MSKHLSKACAGAAIALFVILLVYRMYYELGFAPSPTFEESVQHLWSNWWRLLFSLLGGGVIAVLFPDGTTVEE